eukprot:m.739229 g.739229  ORF g.739229 m.739229 type:complete len:800 (+) comp58918_c0_seq18:999-3398(+)
MRSGRVAGLLSALPGQCGWGEQRRRTNNPKKPNGHAISNPATNMKDDRADGREQARGYDFASVLVCELCKTNRHNFYFPSHIVFVAWLALVGKVRAHAPWWSKHRQERRAQRPRPPGHHPTRPHRTGTARRALWGGRAKDDEHQGLIGPYHQGASWNELTRRGYGAPPSRAPATAAALELCSSADSTALPTAPRHPATYCVAPTEPARLPTRQQRVGGARAQTNLAHSSGGVRGRDLQLVPLLAMGASAFDSAPSAGGRQTAALTDWTMSTGGGVVSRNFPLTAEISSRPNPRHQFLVSAASSNCPGGLSSEGEPIGWGPVGLPKPTAAERAQPPSAFSETANAPRGQLRPDRQLPALPGEFILTTDTIPPFELATMTGDSSTLGARVNLNTQSSSRLASSGDSTSHRPVLGDPQTHFSGSAWTPTTAVLTLKCPDLLPSPGASSSSTSSSSPASRSLEPHAIPKTPKAVSPLSTEALSARLAPTEAEAVVGLTALAHTAVFDDSTCRPAGRPQSRPGPDDLLASPQEALFRFNSTADRSSISSSTTDLSSENSNELPTQRLRHEDLGPQSDPLRASAPYVPAYASRLWALSVDSEPASGVFEGRPEFSSKRSNRHSQPNQSATRAEEHGFLGVDWLSAGQAWQTALATSQFSAFSRAKFELPAEASSTFEAAVRMSEQALPTWMTKAIFPESHSAPRYASQAPHTEAPLQAPAASAEPASGIRRRRMRHSEEERQHLFKHPAACPTCGKLFSCQSKIDRHMVSHTQERPFSCELCGLGFSQRGSLQRHLTHTHKQALT